MSSRWRRPSMKLRRSWNITQKSRLRFRVRARTVDVGDFRAHGAEIGGELAAMMDAMVVGEPDPGRARLLHHAEEVDRLGHLLSRCRPERRQLLGKRLTIERRDR